MPWSGLAADTGREALRLLDRIGVLRNRSDLDLLLFFAEHPSSLLAMESLAAFVGCSHHQIAGSIEVLLAAGVLQRRQTPVHAARLYVFEPSGSVEGWLPELLDLASTREGRLALRFALAGRPPVSERLSETSAGLIP